MPIEKIKLKKTKNMRDMGELPAEGGKKIKCGKLIRCGRLSKLPPKTVEALKAMNIGTVIDLRTNREIAEHPPTILEGVTYHYLYFPGTTPPELSKSRHMSSEVYAQSKRIKRDFGTPENFMVEMYKYIAFDPECRKKLRTVFDLLLSEENCLLFHCNSGTDRTGIIAMLIESVLGVDKEIILDDYMASRTFQRRRRYWQRAGLIIAPVPLKFKRLLFWQMLPKPQYMLRLISEIESRYGSVTDYVKQAIGVTDEEIQLLKLKYLEQ